jgi:uncharacterized membrane protein YfcA
MKTQRSSITEAVFSFLVAIPIALLGGLIGLGGAEFRLPVLVGFLKRSASRSVTINLAVSLVTLIVSLMTRLRVAASAFPLVDFAVILPAMTGGAILAAYGMAGRLARISERQLEFWMRNLLVGIGVLLIVEGFVTIGSLELRHSPLLLQAVVGAGFGALIGLVSSLLGVAGGELIIPTLVFIFGIGIKLAGTASLMISLPTVCAGLIRYARSGVLFDRGDLTGIVTPMGFGSIIGSILGGLLFGIVSPNLLKILLGVVLIYSALRIFLRQRHE